MEYCSVFYVGLPLKSSWFKMQQHRQVCALLEQHIYLWSVAFIGCQCASRFVYLFIKLLHRQSLLCESGQLTNKKHIAKYIKHRIKNRVKTRIKTKLKLEVRKVKKLKRQGEYPQATNHPHSLGCDASSPPCTLDSMVV